MDFVVFKVCIKTGQEICGGVLELDSIDLMANAFIKLKRMALGSINETANPELDALFPCGYIILKELSFIKYCTLVQLFTCCLGITTVPSAMIT